jgi:AcrR family transcriptional regulator
MTTKDRHHEPRRQARGLARMASILDTAEAVFAEIGYDAATTNLIAGRAGISPGSLYQYFANKQAIAEALAERYLEAMALEPDAAFDEILFTLDLPELADLIIDPLLAYTLEHPTTKTFINAGNIPPELLGAAQHLRQSLVMRLAAMIAIRTPALTPSDRTLVAEVTVQVYASFIPTIIEAPPRRRGRIVRELKAVLIAYWADWDRQGGRFRRT